MQKNLNWAPELLDLVHRHQFQLLFSQPLQTWVLVFENGAFSGEKII